MNFFGGAGGGDRRTTEESSESDAAAMAEVEGVAVEVKWKQNNYVF